MNPGAFFKGGYLHVLLLVLILVMGIGLRFTHVDEIGPRLWDEGIYLQEAQFFYSFIGALAESTLLKMEEFRSGQDLWKKQEQIDFIRHRIQGTAPIFGRLSHDLSIALGMVVWGPDDPSVGTRISALTGSLSLLVLYLLARRLYGRWPALVATLIFSLLGYHIHYSRSTLAECTTLLFLLCFFYFYAGSRTAQRHVSSTSLALAAFFLGLSFTTHNRTLIMVGVFFFCEFFLWIKRNPDEPPFRLKRLFVFLVFFFLPLVGWECLYYLALLAAKHLGIVLTAPTFFEQIFVATGRSALWNYISKVYRLDGFLTFPYLLWKSCGLLLFPLILAGILLGLRRRRFPDFLVCTWFLLPYILYSFTTAGLSRTYTVILPAAALLAGSLVSFELPRRPSPSEGFASLNVLLKVLFVLLVLGNGLYYGYRATCTRDGYAPAAAYLRKKNPGNVISTNIPVLEIYLGKGRVVNKPPASEEELARLFHDGYRTYLMDYNRILYTLYQKERADVMDAIGQRIPPERIFPNPFVKKPLTVFEANLFFWDTLAIQKTIQDRDLDKIKIYDLDSFFPTQPNKIKNPGPADPVSPLKMKSGMK